MKRMSSGLRRTLIVLSAAAMLVVSTGIGNVLAVHDEAFQLDGDVSDSTTTTVGTKTQATDWDSLFNADTTRKAFPTDFTASAFKADFATTTSKKGTLVFSTADATTFATGSKDTLDITPGWQCSPANNLLSKNDIMNAYSAAYTDPTSSHQFLYFGMERNSNNGDANVAFWFLQGDADCSSPKGNVAWSGHHTDGDILIVSAFTNGGGVSTINAYRWNDPDGSGPTVGSLGTTSVANGADCSSTLAGDSICATTNGSPSPGLNHSITTPWQTSNATDNVGHTLQPSEFFEGGIDLTANHLGDKCFNTFIGDTRSSQSLTATIFDYARGTLGECKSTTATRAKTGAGANLSSIDIPAIGTLSIKDTATIGVTPASTVFSGTVQFYLCGPSVTEITTCDSSGTPIGSTHAVTANGDVDQTATLTSAGYYCWHAVFSGDSSAGVPGSEDDGTHECFVVNPLQPTLPTQATTGPVDFGSKISDTVTPTGTANKPGTNGVGPGGTINATRGGAATGNVTLTAYGPDCVTAVYGPISIAANGDAALGGPGTTFEFTPAAPGQYTFVASYAGDSPNTLSVPAGTCASQPSNEQVTVRTIPSAITTAPTYFPQDSMTITSTVTGNNLPAGGTVVFRLYGSLASCQAHGDTVGVGGLLYKESKTLGAAAHSQNTATDNTTYRESAASATLYWRVTYAPGDTAHTGRQSDCTESILSTIAADSGSGTLFP
jgi:hypothetical protein